MKAISTQNIKKQAGFTLIELVVVIVILGILAVTAAPKFIDLQDDARTGTLDAVKASMQSAGTIVHSKSLIKGNQDDAAGATPTPQVKVNGTDIDLDFGYPRSDNATEWGNLLDLNTAEFTTVVVAGSIVVHPVGKSAPTSIPTSPYTATPTNNCFAFYTEPTAAGTQPIIQVVDCL